MKDYEEKVLNIMDNARDNIKAQLDKAYKNGYEDAKSELGKKIADIELKGIDKAYQQGSDDAWEVARKLALSGLEGGLYTETIAKIFDGLTYYTVLKNVSASEAIAKIKEYEEQQKQDTEIKVGDEVVLNSNAAYENEKGIILAYDGNSYPYNVLMSNGDTEWVKEDSIERKTNRHFPQIAEVLSEMRGESE